MCIIALAILSGAFMGTVSEVSQDRQDLRSALIREAFNGLTKEKLDVLDKFYDAHVTFEDPLGSIQGLEALRAYYANMYENVTSIRFEFTNEIAEGDTHVAVWTMRMSVKKLNKGREIVVPGNSVIRFNDADKVIYHRDYFDMGAMVYRRVPILRTLVKKVDKRLAHH